MDTKKEFGEGHWEPETKEFMEKFLAGEFKKDKLPNSGHNSPEKEKADSRVFMDFLKTDAFESILKMQ